jgi:hypothetical protein
MNPFFLQLVSQPGKEKRSFLFSFPDSYFNHNNETIYSCSLNQTKIEMEACLSIRKQGRKSGWIQLEVDEAMPNPLGIYSRRIKFNLIIDKLEDVLVASCFLSKYKFNANFIHKLQIFG